LFLGFTAGNHLKLEKADYYKSEFVASLPVYPYYNSEFWELNIGLRKTLSKKRILRFHFHHMPDTGKKAQKDMLWDVTIISFLDWNKFKFWEITLQFNNMAI
jgi:hypothetical protein